VHRNDYTACSSQTSFLLSLLAKDNIGADNNANWNPGPGCIDDERQFKTAKRLVTPLF